MGEVVIGHWSLGHWVIGKIGHWSIVVGQSLLVIRVRILRMEQKREICGSVLILVLWVLFALATLTVAVGAHVSSVMTVSARLWRITESRALAEAGAQQALMAAVSQTNSWDGVAEDGWNRDKDLFSERKLGSGALSVNYLTFSESGTIITNIGIIGEDGKLNINRIVEDKKLKSALENLIKNVGELDSETAKDIVTSIVSKIGEDNDKDEGLTDGTNSDYYAESSLEPENAQRGMKSVAELRMVDGVDDELYMKLLPYVTVYGSGFVNVNCASAAVLNALADACDSGRHDSEVYRSLSLSIVDFQNSGDTFEEAKSSVMYKQLKEFADLSADERNVFSQMMGSITVRSSAFRGISSGICSDGKVSEVSVEFVCDSEKKKFVYWHVIQ